MLRRMRCPPPYSISGLLQYEQFVSQFGKLVTDVYNAVSAYMEEGQLSLVVVAAPPGSGKTYLLYQLASEYGRRWPAVLEQMQGDPQKASEFAEQLEYKLGSAVYRWIHDVLGRDVGCKDPVCVLYVLQAAAVALERQIHLLVLLDEYPLDSLGNDSKLAKDTEIMLKRLAEMPGFATHVVITAHYQGDWNSFLSRVGRGALEKYHVVRWFDRIALAPGFEKDAEEFVKRLACGVQLDRFVAQTGVEMLRSGYNFRHVITFVFGASEGAKKRAADVQVERELHDAVVNAIRSNVKEGRYQGPSRPDVYTDDGRCIEVKVRADARGVNVLQHAGCDTIYVTISPEPVGVKNEIHVRADVHQLVQGLAHLRNRGDDVYRGVLAIMARAIAAEVLQKIGLKKPEPKQPAFCEKLREIFREKPRPTRSELVRSAAFKAIVREILAGVDEACVKAVRADCVDAFAERTEKLYGRSAVRVRGSTVELGDLCREGRTAQLLSG
ncbi:MAG: hypothetical protein ACP5MH_09030 [Thermoproteus sp.]